MKCARKAERMLSMKVGQFPVEAVLVERRSTSMRVLSLVRDR